MMANTEKHVANIIFNIVKKIDTIKHKVYHMLGWNTGHVVAFWCDDTLFIGFQCDHCKRINDAFPTKVRKLKQP